ncbi:MAG: HAMP domain-containing histidine kinase [Flavobacteriales bacterium]|nr:HAMP domain-containing histidine kinase [Flavobacteriales bacterium]
MSRKTIIIVILLAILSLGLIVAGQVFWVRKAYDLQEDQFNKRVFVAISEVVQRIRIMNNDSAATEPVQQVASNSFIANINDTPHPFLLEDLLKDEFERSNLKEDFEYGIYDCFTDSIVYGSRISFKDLNVREQADQIHGLKEFQPDGHYFGVVFPNKSAFILKQLDFWMYSSFVILLIVIFFSYTISAMLKQKRLAEIKTDFVNNMTHELKTPISTIGLSADAIANPSIISNPERLAQYVAIIRNENSRLKSQVERVLQIAALTPNKVNLKDELLDIHLIINNALATFRMQVSELEGSIDVNLRAGNPFMKGDLVHITNVIYNLLDNAIKYTQATPHIEISTHNQGDDLIISVKDNGIGISKANQKMIFEKFYRVPTGNLHSVRGFGLGLYYVKTIVKAHHGKIEVESILGKGSTFTLKYKTAQ